jgi:hypothetical protein
VVISIVGTLVLIGLFIYFVATRRRNGTAVVNARAGETSETERTPD